MNKIIIYSIISILLIAPLVSSGWTSGLNTQIIEYFNMSSDLGAVKGFNLLGQTGASSFTVSLSSIGLIGQSLSINYSGSLTAAVISNATQSTILAPFNNTSINFWFNDTGSLNQEWMIYWRSGAGCLIRTDEGTSLQRTIVTDSCSDGLANELASGEINITGKIWNMFSMARNSTGINFYLNGTFIRSAPIVLNQHVSTTNNETYIGTRDNAQSFFQGLIDEVGFWNRTLTSAEIIQLYNNGFGITFSNSSSFNALTGLTAPANNSIISNNSIIFTANISTIGEGLFNSTTNLVNATNATFYLWNATSSLLNSTINLFTTNNSYNVTNFNISMSNLIKNQYFWNVFGCVKNASASSCNFANSNYTFNLSANIIVNSNSFNATTAIGAIESFITNVSIREGSILSSAKLIWNNLSYSGTISSQGNNNYILSRQIIIPNATGTINWYWSVILDSNQVNLTSNTQTVNGFSIDDCTTNTQKLFNFSLWDEDVNTYQINGTIELIVKILDVQRQSVLKSFNKSYTIFQTGTASETTARVCITPANTTYSVDYQAKYFGNSSYVSEYKFSQNALINNNTATNNVPLYDLLDHRSTTFTITLQSSSLSTIEGAVIDVQRQYVPLNQFISVEGPITDSVGVTQAHLVSNEPYYNFIVTRNGSILGSFNNYLVKCQNEVTGECRITLNLIQATLTLPNFNNYGNISASYDWQSENRILYLNFISTDGNTHLVAWNVTRFDNFGNNTLCTNAITATSGAFSCSVPASYGNFSLQADLYSDGNFLGYNIFSFEPSSGDIFGGTRVILGMLMYTTLTLLLIATPIMIVIGSILGMGFAVAFHLADGGTIIGNTSIVLWFVIAGVILIYYMRRSA